MEIYIYSLILAGYALLYFLSRDAEGTGMTRMAVFLYEKGRALGQNSKGRNVFHESGIRRDLAVLYPYGKLEGEERRFYVERIRIALMILLVGDILAAAGYAAAEGSMLLQGGGLVREEIGGEDRSTQLDAYIVQRAENGERSAAEEAGSESGNAADGKTGREVLTLMRTVSSELGITMILVTHDLTVAEQADRIVRLEDGKVAEDSAKTDCGVSL